MTKFQTRRLPQGIPRKHRACCSLGRRSVGQHLNCTRCTGMRLPSFQAHVTHTTPSPSHLTGRRYVGAVNVVCSNPASVVIVMFCFHYLTRNKPSCVVEKHQLHLPFLAPPSLWRLVVKLRSLQVAGAPHAGGHRQRRLLQVSPVPQRCADHMNAGSALAHPPFCQRSLSLGSPLVPLMQSCTGLCSSASQAHMRLHCIHVQRCLIILATGSSRMLLN